MSFDPRMFARDDVTTWPCFRPTIIAHDVGRSRDRSTAVVGGNSSFQPRLLGIKELEELPQGLSGHPRANALAAIDRRYYGEALIVADLSNDATYAEVLLETFGPRVIGLHITRNGDGMDAERRLVNRGVMLVYTIGRTFLLDLFNTELQANLVRFVDGPESRRAYAQLEGLEMEQRDSGTVYKCLPGQHDDLGISCAMMAWAARHPHLRHWVDTGLASRRPRPRQQQYSWKAFV
jgi:hypothetical protein